MELLAGVRGLREPRAASHDDRHPCSVRWQTSPRPWSPPGGIPVRFPGCAMFAGPGRFCSRRWARPPGLPRRQSVCPRSSPRCSGAFRSTHRSLPFPSSPFPGAFSLGNGCARFRQDLTSRAVGPNLRSRRSERYGKRYYYRDRMRRLDRSDLHREGEPRAPRAGRWPAWRAAHHHQRGGELSGIPGGGGRPHPDVQHAAAGSEIRGEDRLQDGGKGGQARGRDFRTDLRGRGPGGEDRDRGDGGLGPHAGAGRRGGTLRQKRSHDLRNL